MTSGPSPTPPAIDTESRGAAAAFALGGLAMTAAAIEIIIALKFNLHRYPTIPLGVAEINWARLLLVLSCAGFAVAAWRWAGHQTKGRWPAVLAAIGAVIALGDAMLGVAIETAGDDGAVRGHYPIWDLGEFTIRLVPSACLLLVFAALFLLRPGHGGAARDRLSLLGGLVMGIVGIVSLLPSLPFSKIGINALEIGLVDLPEWNLRAWLGETHRVFRGSFKIGPASPSEVFYACMFLLAAFISVVTIGKPDDDLEDRSGYRGISLRIADWLAFAVLTHACFQYVYVGIEKMSFSTFDAVTALTGCLAVLYLCWRVWGAPLALCGAVALLYFFTSDLLPGLLYAEFGGFRSIADNLWFNNSKAVLGSKMGILLNNVLPFLVFGALLSATGAAGSLIRLSFALLRGTRGGPAHAAVVASGLFGTVSGSAVSNVVGTGVITIPMIMRRGFRPEFAGGVEATASTGGQIMPPIMGAAALVMADLTGTSYLNIMIAALVPALAYYLSLFATVMFESRRMEMTAEDTEDVAISRQDYLNVLLLVFVPLLIIILRLIDGASPAGAALTAIVALVGMSVVSPLVRENPVRLLLAVANGGRTFGRLLMVVGVVGIIVGVMSTTDLPGKVGREISDFANVALLLTLMMTAIISLLLGMGMPTLPAYLTVIIILGPALGSLGLSTMTAHMFVFYYGVASAITPPVAVAAFAAAAIAGAKPVETGFAAMRIGVVIFAVPFMFAFNPEMMIVKDAFPDSGGAFHMVDFLSVLARTALMIYLLASATSRFDRRPLSHGAYALRIVLGMLLIAPSPWIYGPAFLVGLGAVAVHALARRAEPAGSTMTGKPLTG